MKEKILSSLSKRLKSEVSKRNPVRFLSEQGNLADALDAAIEVLYVYTRSKRGNSKSILLTEVVCAMGHAIRELYKLSKDSALAAKSGAFMLYSFQDQGLLEVKLGAGTGKHQTYIIEVLKDDAIVALWEALAPEKITSLPSTTGYSDWTSAKHPTGVSLVKTSYKEVLNSLKPETHPLIFDAANIAQRIGWVVNKEIFKTYLWALKEKTDAFSDIWDLQSQEARTSKLREAVAIGSIARKLMDSTFYHMYTYDFRGRRYVSGAYFHEQGGDLAKSFLLYAKKKPITKKGFYWLLISLANNWAGSSGLESKLKTDKLKLPDRVKWALSRETELLRFARTPKDYQGWMKAEKPWQFLANCIELNNFRNYQAALSIEDSLDEEKLYGYETGMVAYIDGSTNGAQHLAALAKDETIAPFVNLVPLDEPGDLYGYVANHVWLKIAADKKKLSPAEIDEANEVINAIIDMKSVISKTPPKSPERAEMIAEMALYREHNRDLIKKASPVFWDRITDAKERRKITKRGVMTISYGSTSYGMSKQVQEDARKHGIPLLLSLEAIWASYMGRSIYEDCKVSLKRLTQLLSKFEAAGKKAEAAKDFLKWNVPVTDFPVVQNYTEGVVKKIYVQYGPPDGERTSTGYFENTLQLAVCFTEDQVPSKRKQSLGASPNAVHSLDAAHLIMTVCNCPFDTTTIHDSFGAALPDMPELFRIVRETFVELYKTNPLNKLMLDIDGDLKGVEIGKLNINDVLHSEYAFA